MVDEFDSYRHLSQVGYEHMTTLHKGQYASPNGESAHQIKVFGRHLKCSIAGNPASVSRKYMARMLRN